MKNRHPWDSLCIRRTVADAEIRITDLHKFFKRKTIYAAVSAILGLVVHNKSVYKVLAPLFREVFGSSAADAKFDILRIDVAGKIGLELGLKLV